MALSSAAQPRPRFEIRNGSGYMKLSPWDPSRKERRVEARLIMEVPPVLLLLLPLCPGRNSFFALGKRGGLFVRKYSDEKREEKGRRAPCFLHKRGPTRYTYKKVSSFNVAEEKSGATEDQGNFVSQISQIILFAFVPQLFAPFPTPPRPTPFSIA